MICVTAICYLSAAARQGADGGLVNQPSLPFAQSEIVLHHQGLVCQEYDTFKCEASLKPLLLSMKPVYRVSDAFWRKALPRGSAASLKRAGVPSPNSPDNRDRAVRAKHLCEKSRDECRKLRAPVRYDITPAREALQLLQWLSAGRHLETGNLFDRLQASLKSSPPDFPQGVAGRVGEPSRKADWLIWRLKVP